MSLNIKLAIAAVCLLALSAFSYYNSVTRAERFERGQKFLTQLNPDNIATIAITKGETSVTLRKGEEAFSVVEKDNYPAKNESVNRFINDMLDIGLEKPVGRGASLEQELELAQSENAMTVVLKNDGGKEMVRFRVGKSSDGGRGNYIQRMDGDDQTIFLTSRGVYLSATADAFLEKEILDLEKDVIASIQGNGWQITRPEEDGALTLQGIPAGKKAKSSEVSQVTGALTGLRYEKVFAADDPAVTGLGFGNPVVFALKNQTGYTVTTATADDKTYAKVVGNFDRSAVQEAGTIDRSAQMSEDEMKERSDTLTAAQGIQDFNDFHGAWVYELSEYVAKRFTKTKDDLIEDEEPEEGE